MKKQLAILVTLCLHALGLSHSDPPGEVHPTVIVKDDQFHVIFGDNSLDRPVGFKTTFSSEGQILKEKEEISRELAIQYFSETRYPEPEEGFFGKYASNHVATFRMRNFHFTKAGKPSLERVSDSKIERIELDWQIHYIDVLEDFALNEDSVFVLATAVIGEPQRYNSETDLWLFHFSIDSGQLIKAIRLGVPSFIYNFPGVSNLDTNKNFITVVWTTTNEDYSKNILNLGVYDVSNGSFRTETLDYPSTWNISISTASIGDILCIAHHGATEKISVNFKNFRQNQSVDTTPASAPR